MSEEIEEKQEVETSEHQEAEYSGTAEVENSAEMAEKQQSDAVEQTENAIKIQAARYAYIEKLENRLAGNERLTPNDLNNVLHCKAQVLLELVGVSNYVAEMPASSPNRKAAEVLIKHLYKCYDKAENLRSKIISTKNDKRGKHQWEDYRYRMLKNQNVFSPVFTDEILLSQNKVINLSKTGLTAGTTGMLSQLINNPSECIKAQMPNLIAEFASKITGTDKETTSKFITSLLNGLTQLKNTKSMTDVLEGVNTFANLLTLKNGNAL